MYDCVLLGPMVWYQKFEYALGHWMQKATEHVFGSVLCSPGCFSLFRANALMDNNVMHTYTREPRNASEIVQYDQGKNQLKLDGRWKTWMRGWDLWPILTWLRQSSLLDTLLKYNHLKFELILFFWYRVYVLLMSNCRGGPLVVHTIIEARLEGRIQCRLRCLHFRTGGLRRVLQAGRYIIHKFNYSWACFLVRVLLKSIL